MVINLLYFLIILVGFVMAYVLLQGTFLKIILRVKKLLKLIPRNVVIFLMMTLLFPCSSCKKNSSFDDPFIKIYQPSQDKIDLSNISSSDGSDITFRPFSLSANRLPFPLFCRVLSDHFDVGIVFSSSLQDKTITAEFKRSSLGDAISVIARQLDVDTVRAGTTFYIGKLRNEDRAILVRKMYTISNNDLLKACQGVMSEKGKISVVSSGVVTASDLPSVLVRLSELLDYLTSIREPVWILQLAFITINKELLIEGGFKVSTSGTISYNLDDNEVKLKDINIDGLLNAAMRSIFSDVYSSPMILCKDGSESIWKYGRRVPVPRKTVSSYGTVTTTGFDYIEVGFNVKATISSSSSGAHLTLSIGKSDVESYVEYAPVVAQNCYQFSAHMQPLKLYLLGELSTFMDTNSQSDILNFGKSRGKSSVQVWGQLYRISPLLNRQFPKK